MTEKLHTCPACQQDCFTATGLKKHQGNKTCKARAASLQLAVVADTPQPLTASQQLMLKAEMQQGANRLKILHEASAITTVQLKLLKFLFGLEANVLTDLHRELYGETRGGGEAKDVPLLGAWVEEHVGITESAWRKRRTFFQSIASAHPELAKKLITCWEKWKSAKVKAPAKPKALKPGAKPVKKKATLVSSPGSKIISLAALTADDAKELLNAADEWHLHELFEQPLKDVSPTNDETTIITSDSGLKFWLDQFTKRALRDDYLKLPKQQREALLTTAKEMTSKLEDSLKKPAPKAA